MDILSIILGFFMGVLFFLIMILVLSHLESKEIEKDPESNRRCTACKKVSSFLNCINHACTKKLCRECYPTWREKNVIEK